jgi:phosphoribosylformimino-5-aminoimidazole carboxamide ribotide isomerase
MRIIAAIDILEGKCVRLTRGDFRTTKVYNEDPLEVAKEFADNGIRFVHLVDLDGAKEKKIINYRILEKIAVRTDLSIDFGGGIRTNNDIRIAFTSGANQVTAGSVAVYDPDLVLSWLSTYGSDMIILGADSRDGKISVNGWQDDSGEEVTAFIKRYVSKGFSYVICTDVKHDGMMEGPSTELYRSVLGESRINLIASGGISSLQDLDVLSEAGCEGAIIGKAIYEGKIKLRELRDLC